MPTRPPRWPSHNAVTKAMPTQNRRRPRKGVTGDGGEPAMTRFWNSSQTPPATHFRVGRGVSSLSRTKSRPRHEDDGQMRID